MKLFCRCTRTFILSLLAVSMFAPIFLLSGSLKYLKSDVTTEFIEDLSSIKYRTEVLQLNAIEQKEGEGVKEPTLVVYKDQNFDPLISFSSDKNITFEESGNDGSNANVSERNGTNQNANGHNQQSQQEKTLSTSRGKEKVKQATARHDQKVRPPSRRLTDEKLKEMKDQVIRAKAYLNFAQPNSNSHLVKELKLRIKELERTMGESTKDSDPSRSALKRMKSMEASLLKASHIYGDCSAMGKKLRAMTYNAEEQVRAQKNQATFLVQLAGRTTPKGLHCLSMRLTAGYFALKPEEREIPGQHKLFDPQLHHFAVFSDNVLACAVVVNSAITTAKEPEKIIFHIVTDTLNFPAISMWFLLNPPGKATIRIQSTDSFDWLSSKYDTTMQKQNSPDPRYTSALNHLRFYLPDIFPKLNKVALLDHDVVVQRDLTKLWRVNMKGKVNGAVETCQKDEPSYRQMDMLINFSDPMVARRFDVKACTWAFGMNIFDLQEWRRRNLTGVYHKYLQLGIKRPLWKAGSLPLGWVTFYNQTVALDRRWHLLGLGHHGRIRQADIEQSAVIHYDGVMKPWLDIGLENYKQYWRKHVNYDHPYLQQCNIHQ